MKLGKMYSFLLQQPQNRTCSYGFTNPHSYRGCYDELAFEPTNNVTIEHMVSCCKRAVSETFFGWKGGEFTYTEDTPIHIAYDGYCHDEEQVFSPEILMSIAGLDD